MAKLYTCANVEALINRYTENGGEFFQLEEGGTGYGLAVLAPAAGCSLFSFVITEVYLNEWSSAHTIRKYKKLPEKYAKKIAAL